MITDDGLIVGCRFAPLFNWFGGFLENSHGMDWALNMHLLKKALQELPFVALWESLRKTWEN